MDSVVGTVADLRELAALDEELSGRRHTSIWRKRRLLTAGAGCLAPDAGEESAEGIFIVEAGAEEVDPGMKPQEARDLAECRFISPRKENGDDSEGRLSGRSVQCQLRLLCSPGSTSRPWTEKEGMRGAGDRTTPLPGSLRKKFLRLLDKYQTLLTMSP